MARIPVNSILAITSLVTILVVVPGGVVIGTSSPYISLKWGNLTTNLKDIVSVAAALKTWLLKLVIWYHNSPSTVAWRWIPLAA